MSNSINIDLSHVENSVLPVYRNQLYNYNYTTNVYYGSSSSGKSYFIQQKLIIKSLIEPRCILLVRKVGTSIRDSIWRVTKGLIQQGLPRGSYTINKSEFTINLVNGTQFLFKGLDDPEKIKSLDGVTDIFIEEASELSEDDFDQLTLRLRGHALYKQIYLAFNPINKTHWLYRRFFTPESRKTLKSTFIKKTTYKDNPALAPDQIAAIEALKITNPNYYRIYALGEWGVTGKLVINSYTYRQITDEEIVSFNQNIGKSIFRWAGLDWGFSNDPTVVTAGYYEPIYPVPNLYITQESHEYGLTNDKIADILKTNYSRDKVVYDSAEKKSGQEVINFGFKHMTPSLKGQGSVQLGIDRINRCNIILSTACPYTKEEFDSYQYKKDPKTGLYLNEPVDANNHHVDSIRYGIQLVINKKLRKPEDFKKYAEFY